MVQKSCNKSTIGEQALKAQRWHTNVTKLLFFFYLISLLKSHSVMRRVVPFFVAFKIKEISCMDSGYSALGNNIEKKGQEGG